MSSLNSNGNATRIDGYRKVRFDRPAIKASGGAWRCFHNCVAPPARVCASAGPSPDHTEPLTPVFALTYSQSLAHHDSWLLVCNHIVDMFT